MRERFLDTLRSAFSTVSDVPLFERREEFTSAFNPVPLGHHAAYQLSARHFFVVVADTGAPEGWAVRTVGYFYVLLDDKGRQLIAYHWHSTGQSRVTRPHLHLGSRLLRPEFARSFPQAHLPTEPVPLIALLRTAIEDLGVEPLRDDWAERLAAAEIDLRRSHAEFA